MKLLKFPVLVFDNIMKQLDTIPLVSLSFCSRKTRERIKRVSFSIEFVRFANQFKGRRGYAIQVRSPQQSLFVSFQAPTWEFRKKKPEKLSVRIGDTVYNCRYLQEDGNDIYLGYFGYKKASLFFNYILDLVRTSITEIFIDLNKIADIKQFLSEPCFRNVQKISLVGEIVPEKKVIELFDCFNKPVLETRVRTQIKSLSPTSKLLQSENLVFDPSRFISIEHLLNFTGKYITMYFTSLSEEDIVTFVKHWLDGNYPNLEGAYITSSLEREFETEKVLDEFNTKRWNPAERAQNFIFKASYDLDEKKNEYPTKDCSNGFDLDRSDGLMATMQFEEDDYLFNFVVWHNRFP